MRGKLWKMEAKQLVISVEHANDRPMYVFKYLETPAVA